MKLSLINRFPRAKCRLLAGALTLSLLGTLSLLPSQIVQAAKKPTAAEIAAAEAAEAERQAAYAKTIETNGIENWPQGPQIYAESAIVMEASTGTILYGKDVDMVNYPASITKIMTALLVLENCSLDEVVTYSFYAVNSIESGSSSIGTKNGEQLTVEQSLYALLLSSANECANGLAEHVAGSIDAFVEMMNAKAAELGCTNTHFVNPNGLHDDAHYTTCHDMAIIMQAALQNEDFVRISGTDRYQIPPTEKYDEIRYLVNHHYMIAPYKSVTTYLDDTVIAGKTGYTSNARYTLVTAAERNGMTLIVVTMRTANASDYFSDTALLLDYAGENFAKINVAENESKFSVATSNSFYTGSSIFGSSQPLIEIDSGDYIVLPGGAAFSDVSAELVFNEEGDSNLIATLKYTFGGQPVGTASILLDTTNLQEFTFDTETGAKENVSDADTDTPSAASSQKRFIKINVRIILEAVLGILVVLLLIFIIRKILRNMRLGPRFSSRKEKYQHSKSKKKRPLLRTKKKPTARYQRTPKHRDSHSSMNDLDL